MNPIATSHIRLATPLQKPSRLHIPQIDPNTGTLLCPISRRFLRLLYTVQLQEPFRAQIGQIAIPAVLRARSRQKLRTAGNRSFVRQEFRLPDGNVQTGGRVFPRFFKPGDCRGNVAVQLCRLRTSHEAPQLRCRAFFASRHIFPLRTCSRQLFTTHLISLQLFTIYSFSLQLFTIHFFFHQLGFHALSRQLSRHLLTRPSQRRQLHQIPAVFPPSSDSPANTRPETG